MAAEQNAWHRLRDELLTRWGYTQWYRIESPLTAPGFPDIVAFRDAGVHFIELKAWASPRIHVPHPMSIEGGQMTQGAGFREQDIPWRPGQQIVLRQIARAGGKAFVCCCVDVESWWWGRVLGTGAIIFQHRAT